MIVRKEILEQLSKDLSLPYTGTEQDWDIEMADSKRIDEFLKFYQQNELSENKRVAIMSLIVASYDDFLNENDLEFDDRWNHIKSVLESESAIFNDLKDYWSLREEVKDDIFRITPLMRKIK